MNKKLQKEHNMLRFLLDIRFFLNKLENLIIFEMISVKIIILYMYCI